MPIRGTYLVEFVFLLSSASTIFLILRRPYLRFRTRQRRLRLETYFLGALLGPVLLLALGLLDFPQAVDGLSGTAGHSPLGILSLFVTVAALRHYGITAGIGRLAGDIFGSRPVPLVFAYGTAAALATTIGSNLGANLTPLGALAGIMWMSILRWKRVRLGFLRFVGYGLLVTPASLAAALLALAAEFALF